MPAIGGKGINIREIPRLKVGLDYVPFDEFPAILHKGERVLTAEEAEQQDRGEAGATYNIYLNDMPAADSDKRKLAQYIEGRTPQGLDGKGGDGMSGFNQMLIGSTDISHYGLYLVKVPPIVKPPKRVRRITIPGRSGHLTEWSGDYELHQGAGVLLFRLRS